MLTDVHCIEVDESRFPLLVVSFHGVVSDEKFDAYLATITRRLRRRDRYVTLVDATRAGHIPATQRKKQADWQRSHTELLRTHNLGTAFALSSPMIRGFLTAIFWMQALPSPHHVAATRAEAEGWALECLRRHGLCIPATHALTAR
ncbi:MAG: hypothetical protein ABJE95_34565 [Byssovorax sp.]